MLSTLIFSVFNYVGPMNEVFYENNSLKSENIMVEVQIVGSYI